VTFCLRGGEKNVKCKISNVKCKSGFSEMKISFSHELKNLTPNPSPGREGSKWDFLLNKLRVSLCLCVFVAIENS
jgi:hypothetical protein